MCPMCIAAMVWSVLGATSIGGGITFAVAKVIRSATGRKIAATILGKCSCTDESSSACGTRHPHVEESRVAHSN